MFKKTTPKFSDSKPLEEEPEVVELKKEVARLKNLRKDEAPTPEPVQEEAQDESSEQETTGKAKIVSSELLENGVIRTTLISNVSLGEVGQTFEL